VIVKCNRLAVNSNSLTVFSFADRLYLKHAIKYALSRKFPGINNRITDLILELENNRQMQTQVNISYERHLQRRRDGWLSGYKLKTKRYGENGTEIRENSDASMDTYDAKDKVNERDVANDESTTECKESDHSDTNEKGVGPSTERTENATNESSENEPSMCTICLLDIEEGDIIADLKCGHVYHASCLSEWILKKVRSL
jgi:hypothetical protein